MIPDNIRDGEAELTCYSLIDRARAGEESAWILLVKLYTPLVLYWCRQSKVEKASEMDIGQEVFVAAYKSLDRFKRCNSGSFRGWLRTICKRRTADFFRSKAKNLVKVPVGGSVALEVLKDTAAPEEEEISREKKLLYRQAIKIVESEFQEKHRQAFLLLVVDGWKAKDAAEKLSMTANAVYMARHRILNRLQEAFADLLE